MKWKVPVLSLGEINVSMVVEWLWARIRQTRIIDLAFQTSYCKYKIYTLKNVKIADQIKTCLRPQHNIQVK